MTNRNTNIFTARYSANCNQCGQWFSRGARIVTVGSNVYAHLNCNPQLNNGWMPGRGSAPVLAGGWRNQTAGGWSN